MLVLNFQFLCCGQQILTDSFSEPLKPFHEGRFCLQVDDTSLVQKADCFFRLLDKASNPELDMGLNGRRLLGILEVSLQVCSAGSRLIETVLYDVNRV